jgi:excisionase family DNA binding protein
MVATAPRRNDETTSVPSTHPGEPVETQPGDLLTIRETLIILRTSRPTLRRLIRSGALPATMVGTTYRIRRSDVEEYLASRLVGSTTPNDAA